MSAQLGDALTPELCDTLTNLAAGLVGLDAWIKEPGKYMPNGALPWRAAGHTFAPADLAVIPFFNQLLRESSADAAFGVRWGVLAANPRQCAPVAYVDSARRSHRLA